MGNNCWGNNTDNQKDKKLTFKNNETSGNLWDYYRDEVNDNANENNADNYRINNNKAITSKCSEYNTKLIGSTPNANNTLNEELVVPWKCLSNFWRFFDFSLINFSFSLDMVYTIKKRKILRKKNYVQRNLDEKRSVRP